VKHYVTLLAIIFTHNTISDTKKENTDPTIIPIIYIIGIVYEWLILNYRIRSNGIR